MRSTLLATLLSATALAYPQHILGFAGNSRLDYCSYPDNPLIDVTKVDVKQGTGRSLTLTGTAKTDILDGTLSFVDLQLPVFGGPGQEFDFCKDLGVKCPVKKGETFTATHNLNVKLFFGFPENNYNAQVIIVRDRRFPPDWVLCLDGPWKASTSSSSVSRHDYELEWPMTEAEARWDMK